MITVTQHEDQYEIRFPYDQELVELVKNVPGRSWHPETKCWSIPLARLGFFIAQVKGTKYEPQVQIYSKEDLNINASIDESNKVPDVDISDYTFRVQKGSTPFKHQVDTVKFCKWRYENGLKSGFLLADEPGAGKSLSAMNMAFFSRQKYGLKHCLIIACVNGAKYNWVDDILKHTNGEEIPYILGTRHHRDGSEKYDTDSAAKLDDLILLKKYGKRGTEALPFFLIMNIEAIRMREGKRYPLAERLIELINTDYIGMIALDEVHHGVSMQSLQGKKLLDVKKKTKQIQWLPMTGTPITSKPTDVFLPLRLVDGHSSSSYYNWCQNFCVYGGFGGHDIVGYKNIAELKNMLQPNMLRRLKKNILDLPPKIKHTEYVENTAYQAKLYHKINEELLSDRDQIRHALNPLSKFLRLRQVNGSPELVDGLLDISAKDYLSKNAKLSRLLELIDDILSNPDEKIVIFSNWVEPLRTLYTFIKKSYKVCCYTGTMSQEDRELHKKTFIENPEYRIILGTVGALGTSHTLTVARNVIFYDSPWNPADIEQCEDRCHRPGTTQSVNIYTLITKDTVDETVHKILSRKEGTSQYIVDNNLDLHNHPELIDLLLKEAR